MLIGLAVEANFLSASSLRIPTDEASKELNEIERILDELADGIPEPTLVRLGEEDVTLDMDEIMVDVVDEEESESSDSGGDSEEGGE